ncbi:MAG: hypothetical protein AAFU55_15975 [Pseudomonadota bacterium]
MSDPSALLPRLIPVRDLPKAAKTTRQDAATKAERAAIAEAPLRAVMPDRVTLD